MPGLLRRHVHRGFDFRKSDQLEGHAVPNLQAGRLAEQKIRRGVGLPPEVVRHHHPGLGQNQQGLLRRKQDGREAGLRQLPVFCFVVGQEDGPEGLGGERAVAIAILDVVQQPAPHPAGEDRQIGFGGLPGQFPKLSGDVVAHGSSFPARRPGPPAIQRLGENALGIGLSEKEDNGQMHFAAGFSDAHDASLPGKARRV